MSESKKPDSSDKTMLYGDKTAHGSNAEPAAVEQPVLGQAVGNLAYLANLQTVLGGGNAPANEPIPCPARYEILNELGQGGMGLVYKARDKKLARIVALKFLLRMSKTDTKDVERFQREARVMAQLHHPNIIAIHDIGEEERYPFFTMDFIEGVSFRQFLQHPKRDMKQAIQILIQVGRAVHYAHSQGIIHRDLKPSNIMITHDNVPKVMDFGLAKVSNLRDDLSKAGEAMGTPAYMSPEQAEGAQDLDARADIYALGATLYETLTLRPPFQGETYFNILTQLLNREPVSPGRINPDIAAELEAICLKSLEKDRSKRYASAELWSQDLENFLAQRPVTAKVPTLWTHLYKFILRNKLVVGAGVLLFCSILAGGLLSLVGWQRAEAEKQRAETLSQKNADEARYHRITLVKIALGKAREMAANKDWHKSGVLAGNVLQMLQGLKLKEEEKSLEQEAETLLRFSYAEHGLVWQARAAAPTEKEATALFSVLTAAFSPNGRLIAAGSWDKTVVVYDAASGKPQLSTWKISKLLYVL
jgi:tRNA A-37 threonylcarbamoyl transferase component Bud32